MDPRTGDSEPDDGAETAALLYGVATLSINDAILCLAGMHCAAEPHLKRALAVLITASAAELTLPEATLLPKPTLSAHAIDLIVEQRLRDIDADPLEFDQAKPVLRSIAHAATIDRSRQKAVMLMLEAIAHLDRLLDAEVIAHLHSAIDRTLQADPSVTGTVAGKRADPQQPN